MRTSVKMVVAALTAVAGWSAASQAQNLTRPGDGSAGPTDAGFFGPTVANTGPKDPGVVTPTSGQEDNARTSLPWIVTINNTANAGRSVAITIYDNKFAVVVTDCLPGDSIRNYTSPNARDMIGGGGTDGMYIRYQVFSQTNGCQGSLLLDTAYGQELHDSSGVYPLQNVPAPAPA